MQWLIIRNKIYHFITDKYLKLSILGISFLALPAYSLLVYFY